MKRIPSNPLLLHYNPFSGPDFPKLFRRNFPNEGPALYESRLRQHGFQEKYFRDLGLISHKDRFLLNLIPFEEVISLFKFVERPLNKMMGTNEPTVDLLDFWFNKFWYGGLADYFEGERIKQQYSFNPVEKIIEQACLLNSGQLLIGRHFFPNPFDIRKIFYKYDIPFPDLIEKKYPVYSKREMFVSEKEGQFEIESIDS